MVCLQGPFSPVAVRRMCCRERRNGTCSLSAFNSVAFGCLYQILIYVEELVCLQHVLVVKFDVQLYFFVFSFKLRRRQRIRRNNGWLTKAPDAKLLWK